MIVYVPLQEFEKIQQSWVTTVSVWDVILNFMQVLNISKMVHVL